MFELAYCSECGDVFYRDAEWKRTCLPCWKRKQNSAPKRSNQTEQALRAEIYRLAQEVSRLHQYRAIPDDMLPRLIRLCHPDKHGNSEAANKATAWLLSMRESIKP